MDKIQINMTLAGRVVSVKSTKSANYLQFFGYNDDGSSILIDVKVDGAKREDLEKFVGKIVKLNGVKHYRVDFKDFYKVPDVSLIKVLDSSK